MPCDAFQTAALTRYLASSPRPAYVRMGRGAVPTVYENGAPFTVGKANRLREGGDAAIIACGEMVYPALEASKLLAGNGVRASVYDKPARRGSDTRGG